MSFLFIYPLLLEWFDASVIAINNKYMFPYYYNNNNNRKNTYRTMNGMQ